MYSYYPRHGWNAYRPCRYCYRPYYYPYNNYFNSQFAYADQSIYNSGIMNDVFQQSIISQAAPDEDTQPLEQEPTPTPTPTPEPTPPPSDVPMPEPWPTPCPPVQSMEPTEFYMHGA